MCLSLLLRLVDVDASLSQIVINVLAVSKSVDFDQSSVVVLVGFAPVNATFESSIASTEGETPCFQNKIYTADCGREGMPNISPSESNKDSLGVQTIGPEWRKQIWCYVDQKQEALTA